MESVCAPGSQARIVMIETYPKGETKLLNKRLKEPIMVRLDIKVATRDITFGTLKSFGVHLPLPKMSIWANLEGK